MADATTIDAFIKRIGELRSAADKLAKVSPVVQFTTNPLWSRAAWSATTFQWHPSSAAPPIMGLVFDNAHAAQSLFREFAKSNNHSDRFEELRVSIIEGSPPGLPDGYSVHLCPDPEALAMHATGVELVMDAEVSRSLGKWSRMYPTPGSPSLLTRFKAEFEKHHEFLLAPVTVRADGQRFVDIDSGIVKNCIAVRQLSDVSCEDVDALALHLPGLTVPR
jgi:hypothetical protein